VGYEVHNLILKMAATQGKKRRKFLTKKGAVMLEARRKEWTQR
jgi:hypothetical protein